MTSGTERRGLTWMTWPERETWLRNFTKGSAPRMVFGWNRWAESVCRELPIDAVVDDRLESTSVNGLPVIRLDDVPPGAMVVSTIVGIRPLSALRNLASRNIDCLDYFSLLRLCGTRLEPISFWKGFSHDFEQNREAYRTITDRFADEQSREEFERIVAFRDTMDLRHMDGFTDRQTEQYFEPFVRFAEKDVFFDVGGFDGATTVEFVRRNPRYGAVHIFEPSPANRRVMESRVGHLRNVQIHGLALGAAHGTVDILEDGSSSTVVHGTGRPVQVVPLDAITTAIPTLIKVDIEGAELDMLEGASNTINRHRPSVIVAAYHSGDHLRKIWEKVTSLHGDYRIYFRHYTEGFVESDLFFIAN